MSKLPVAVYGATGLVGQHLVARLIHHPWFELAEVAASSRSAGLKYQKAIGPAWRHSTPQPGWLAAMPVKQCTADTDARIVFSALNSDTARELEPALADAGKIVCSNASAHRMNPDVPLIIPEINGDALKLKKEPASGAIICNTNCAVSGIAMVLAPLERTFGLHSVSAVTLQSISGAGLTGLNAMDIHDTVLPGIPGEADKIEAEVQKVLDRKINIACQTWRVPVRRGHSFTLHIETEKAVDSAMLERTLADYRPAIGDLPSRPESPLEVVPTPEPGLLPAHHPMSVLAGRPRVQGSHRLIVDGCVDNLERGAAGAAVLNAELICGRYKLAG